jgi:hypothetical protein
VVVVVRVPPGVKDLKVLRDLRGLRGLKDPQVQVKRSHQLKLL